jgi:hypothetical protein
MPESKLLVTGEFWHPDFADLIGRVEIPASLIPTDRLSKLTCCDESYTAIIVAQSRRGAVAKTFMDHVGELFPNCPLIVLLGSWCEGDLRSGQPLKSALRIFWHQWNGSYRQLSEQLARQGIQIGLAKTAAGATEQVGTSLDVNEKQDKPSSFATCAIGVSALTLSQFETVEDALRELKLAAIWLEQATWQATKLAEIAAICVDSDSLVESLEKRLEFVRESHPNSTLILMMNFPRKSEVVALRKRFNVAAVVSKPFDLLRLYQGLAAAGIPASPPATIIPTISVPDVRDAPVCN